MSDFPLPIDGLPLRSCGRCTACCTSFEIRELNKPMFVPCPWVKKKKGCTQYDTRPQSCRQFDCVWRKGLGSEKSRPDKSGVVFMPTPHGDGLLVVIDPGLQKNWYRGEIRQIVDWHYDRGIPVFAMGRDFRKSFIPDNSHMTDEEIRQLEEAFLSKN